LENVWSELKTTYNGDFKNLVYGKLPKEEAILETLKMIQERLKTISWTIKTEPKRMKFTEAQLEKAFIHLLQQEEMQHVLGNDLRKTEGNMVEESRETYGHIATEKVLIEEDLRTFLTMQYREEGITRSEIDGIIRELEQLPASDLYESNKIFMKKLSDGFLLKREDRTQKDIFIQFIDYSEADQNIIKS
jgi:type I restriction enzyme R subunit